VATVFGEASISCAKLKKIFNVFEENWISEIKESFNVKVKNLKKLCCSLMSRDNHICIKL
jgi:hypothetical protein